MTPEGRVKERVKKLLKKHGAYSFMPVQAGYGQPALDFHAIHLGAAICIETKAGKKKPTARQENTIRAIREAKGFTIVVNEDPETLKRLELWLIWNECRYQLAKGQKVDPSELSKRLNTS